MLNVIMYHYVRDLPRTAYPQIKGMLLDDFRGQVCALAEEFEMASFEACMAYLSGEYSPSRDLCLLTFDDGLKEHYSEVTPILQDAGIQGVFHIITSCAGEQQVAPVHMNHFLMAKLGFEEYQRLFMDSLTLPAATDTDFESRRDRARKAYPWDKPEVAEFKYFFNFQLDPEVRDGVVRELFERHVGGVDEFSRELYLSWDEAQEMQRAGMVIGGHTHEHQPLSNLSDDRLAADLSRSTRLLHENLEPQSLWPFCYPYGKSDSFSPAAVEMLKALGYACAFTAETGSAAAGDDPFTIRRFDCKKAPSKATASLVRSRSAS